MPAKAPTAALPLYERLVATNPRVERKGAGLPYTSVNGRMFTFLSESGSVGIRLPAGPREDFLRKYKTTLFRAHGRILKDFVTVPAPLLKKTRELQMYYELSFEHAKSLPAKPSRSRKA